jgi:hypothetical protein
MGNHLFALYDVFNRNHWLPAAQYLGLHLGQSFGFGGDLGFSLHRIALRIHNKN